MHSLYEMGEVLEEKQESLRSDLRFEDVRGDDAETGRCPDPGPDPDGRVHTRVR